MIVNPELSLAKLSAEHFGVERAADIECEFQSILQLVQLGIAETDFRKRFAIDEPRLLQRGCPSRIFHYFFDFFAFVAEFGKSVRNRAIDDFEIAAAGQLLEFHDREIGLYAGGVAVHNQADRSSRGNQRGLRISVAMQFAEFDRLVPSFRSKFSEFGIGTCVGVQRYGSNVQAFVSVGISPCRISVVPHHAKHFRRIFPVSFERT